MALLPPVPDGVQQKVIALAAELAKNTARYPEEFIRPLMGAVDVLWNEVHRQALLGVEHALCTETFEDLKRIHSARTKP